MSSVILINSFEFPKEKENEAIRYWEIAADYMRSQPGFISTRLHKAVSPDARFRLVNIAEWESAEHFINVVNSDEFKSLTEPEKELFPHYPGLYEVIRT